MYQKFIINHDGVLKFGRVYRHKDLLEYDEDCLYGGGFWTIDNERGAILLYGRSFDYGAPNIRMVSRVDWSGVGGKPMPIFFVPHWPDEDMLVPICNLFC